MTEPLTVVCWKWKGWRSHYYTPAHVHALARMLKKHLKRPYKLVCITDDPTGITECETFPIWDDKDEYRLGPRDFNCFRRLRVFSDEISKQLGSRIVSMDLDMLITGDITDLFAGDEDFKIIEGTVADYNGSMFMFKAGTHSDIWDNLPSDPMAVINDHNTKMRKRVNFGSDQAWMSMMIKDAPVWTTEDGIHPYRVIKETGAPPNTRLVYFAGLIKPWQGACKFEQPQLHGKYMKYFDGKVS